MDESTYKTSFIKANWPLVAVMVALLVVGAVLYLRQSGEEYATTPEAIAPRAVPPGPVATTFQAPVEGKSDREHTLEVIAEHRRKMKTDPTSEEAPALLAAMGNLYAQKLNDHAEAIKCYERILADYPDWVNIRAVYIQLASSYAALKHSENEQWVYRQMLRHFPEDSQEYEYAQQQLRRRD